MEPLAGLLAACATVGSTPALLEAPLPPAGPEGRAARVGRGKRARGDEAGSLVQPRKKRLPPKRPIGWKAKEEVPPPQRRGKPPRSPDEKRKLSRQMAAFMRYGVLQLPEHVKARPAAWPPWGPRLGGRPAAHPRPA